MWPFSKRRNSPGRQSVVLGTQMAAARIEEQARIARGDLPPNPITPDMAYDWYNGDLDLVHLQLLPADGKLAEVCHRYAASDAGARAVMRAGIDMDGLYTLFNFSMRSAAFALREQSVPRIRDGLTALSMVEPRRMDYRDVLRALGLLHGVALEIGENGDELVKDVAEMADASTRALMMRHAQERAGDKGLHGNGFAIVKTEQGGVIVGWSFEPYAPTCAMERVAFAIGDLIRADQYVPSITLGEELPAVWLNGIDDPALHDALAKTVAGAIVGGNLRPAASPDHKSQQLTIFLLELADVESAEVLLNLARAKIALTLKGTVAMLARRDHKLFCLVVARAFQMGKESFESTESLARLGPGIDAALRQQ